ncbi:unnamed protein product [Arabidopsis halleri]
MADSCCIRLLHLAFVFLLLISSFNLQCTAAGNLSKQKLTSQILQNEIVKEVNENPNAGWKASLNDRFANATVAEFKRLLGVKPTPKTAYLGVPIVRHDLSLKLPKEFDARTAWLQCTSIRRILGRF